MAAAAALLVDEVEMKAADLDPLDVFGKAEAEHRPGQIEQLEDMLLGDDLGQRPVGRGLAGNRAGADELEASIKSDRTGGSPGGYQLVESRQQLFVAERSVEALIDLGLEVGDHCERRSRRRLHLAHRPIDVGAIEAPVEGNHLPVQSVQRAEAQIA